MMQMELFTTSPINAERLTGQNKRLYDWLLTGNSIHCMHPAKQELRIGYLNSRCSDLKKAGVPIEKKYIQVVSNGESVTVVEYSIKNNF